VVQNADYTKAEEKSPADKEAASPRSNFHYESQDENTCERQTTEDSGRVTDSPGFPSGRSGEGAAATGTAASRTDPTRDPYSDIDFSYETLQTGPTGIEGNIHSVSGIADIKKVRKPIIRKTFALKKVGYKVIPYEDETDSRYSFRSENVVFVNKANSAYSSEAKRGDEFLLRHIIRIVAEALAEAKHPEAKEALELQNRLIAEAIRIHDHSVSKK
jgi:hypothetical protein